MLAAGQINMASTTIPSLSRYWIKSSMCFHLKVSTPHRCQITTTSEGVIIINNYFLTKPIHMNTETLEKMKKMRLLGMHRTFQTSLQTPRSENLTVDEMIAQLIDSEWDDRHNRAIDRSMKRAKFRYNATLENLDYAPERGIDKNQIHRFADGSFIKKNENILITGSTGTGKSFLASALGDRKSVV